MNCGRDWKENMETMPPKRKEKWEERRKENPVTNAQMTAVRGRQPDMCNPRKASTLLCL